MHDTTEEWRKCNDFNLRPVALFNDVQTERVHSSINYHTLLVRASEQAMHTSQSVDCADIWSYWVSNRVDFCKCDFVLLVCQTTKSKIGSFQSCLCVVRPQIVSSDSSLPATLNSMTLCLQAFVAYNPGFTQKKNCSDL